MDQPSRPGRTDTPRDLQRVTPDRTLILVDRLPSAMRGNSRVRNLVSARRRRIHCHRLVLHRRVEPGTSLRMRILVSTRMSLIAVMALMVGTLALERSGRAAGRDVGRARQRSPQEVACSTVMALRTCQVCFRLHGGKASEYVGQGDESGRWRSG